MGMTMIAKRRHTLPTATVRVADTDPKRRRRVTKASAALWTAQALLGLVFAFAGASKLLVPIDVLTALSPLPGPFLRFLGVAELVGVLGLILPGLLRIRPVLTPIAAGCLSAIVAGATILTLAGGDVSGAVLPFVTLLLSLFVAFGRTRLASSAGRAGRGVVRITRLASLHLPLPRGSEAVTWLTSSERPAWSKAMATCGRSMGWLDLAVPEGTILALLGPNGAGKTTAVRILTTLLNADGGSAEVAGIDVRRDSSAVRARIGLSGQYSAVDTYLTGFENLDMVGRLYGLGRRCSRERARELLERFDLAGDADRPVKTYSGGMRRRLDLAGALVAQPPVLFLDEPTTGLDPGSRADMWDLIVELVKAGTTLLLTTQYLEEADRLANDIVVIDHGREIAHGTADQLKAQVGGERVEIVVAKAEDMAGAYAVLVKLADGPVVADDHTRRLTAPVAGGAGALMDALRGLDANGIAVLDVALRRPTLDDVFLTLTGPGACEAEPQLAAAAGAANGPRQAAGE